MDVSEIPGIVALVRALKAEGVTHFEGCGVKLALHPGAVHVAGESPAETGKAQVTKGPTLSREERERQLDEAVRGHVKIHGRAA